MTESRPLPAAESIRVYLTLVPYLLERQPVALEDAARDFDLSPKQMREMVVSLTFMGQPGDALYPALPYDLFDINWDLLEDEDIIELTNVVALEHVQRFSAREASALLAGLQFVASIPDIADEGLIAGLLEKLSRGAASTPAAMLVGAKLPEDVRTVVTEALKKNVAVSFDYQALDASEVTTRTVDPVRLINAQAEWYLQGWCHLREGMRTFHLERVTNPKLTEIANEHLNLTPPTLFESDDDDDELTVVAMNESIFKLTEDVLPKSVIEQSGSDVVARMKLADPRTLKRLAARFAGELVITEPASARAATREWAEQGLALYNQSIHS